MNAKLQKEIFNFLSLKIKVAFAKNGLSIGKDRSSTILSSNSAEEFFQNIEEKISRKTAN